MPACSTARLSRADVRVYPHGDWQRLDQLLGQAGKHRRRLIVTDSLFSMDGTSPARGTGCLGRAVRSDVDDRQAHATGVFGPRGRGVAEQLLEDRIHVRVGTLSKALGSIGGFVAGSRLLVDWLVNRARPYVFSTAPPAAMAAAALAALEIVDREPQRRRELLARAAQLRETLVADGWNTGASASRFFR